MNPSGSAAYSSRSEEHTSELQSHSDLVCRLLLEKKKHATDGIREWHICRLDELATMGTTQFLSRLSDALASLAKLDQASYLSHSFFFKVPPTTDLYTLSLHDALPI